MLNRLCLCLVLSVATAVYADELTVPFVADATENAAGTQIVINGVGFGTLAPNVSLGDTALSLVSFSNTKITAKLPSGLVPGSYLLTIGKP